MLAAALAKWLAYREERRRPCTPTEMGCLVDQIREQSQIYGDKAVVEVVLLSISNGWQGVAWDRLGKQSSSGSIRGSSGGKRETIDCIKADMEQMARYRQKLREEAEDSGGN